MSAPTRERVGKYRFLVVAADAMRHTRTEHGTAVVDCPRCPAVIRTRRPLALANAAWEGSPLHSALHEHLFRDCPTTEVAR